MLSIIVPTLNEAECVGPLAERIAAALAGERYEVIVVDDDSPDGTWRVAGELPARLNVRVVRRRGGRDLSRAVVEGFAAAAGELICVMDADLSHPPEILPALLAAVREQGADLAIASRLVPGGAAEGWPRSRALNSRVATLLARPLTAVRDPMSGYFLFRRDVLAGVSLKPRGYKIGLEIIVKGNAAKIVEVPFVFRDRTAGKSKLGLRQRFEYLGQVFDLYLEALKRRARARRAG
ncbi:MAG TPA: polyprenol monophosphomannose synthase [bacterium]